MPQRCRDNFEGPQCSACRKGYYHDLYADTCKICSCPHPDEANKCVNESTWSPSSISIDNQFYRIHGRMQFTARFAFQFCNFLRSYTERRNDRMPLLARIQWKAVWKVVLITITIIIIIIIITIIKWNNFLFSDFLMKNNYIQLPLLNRAGVMLDSGEIQWAQGEDARSAIATTTWTNGTPTRATTGRGSVTTVSMKPAATTARDAGTVTMAMPFLQRTAEVSFNCIHFLIGSFQSTRR